jgi:hypothetical protein
LIKSKRLIITLTIHWSAFQTILYSLSINPTRKAATSMTA